MAEQLNDLLDVCLDRIARGDTVEECLARYPEQAAGLEPSLRIAAQYVRTFHVTTSAESKALGRRRLQSELAALNARASVDNVTLDEALDRCISRILRGETVQVCLEAYPQYAQELAPSLRAAARSADAFALPVSVQAKAEGRLRLQRENEALERAAAPRPAGRSLWLSFVFALQQRWAVASAAAAFAIVAGGFGLVSASDDALPGQTLYPIKRAAEDVRLALDRSPEAKAQRYLAYAERRGQEMTALIERGKTEKLGVAQAALEEHVSKATEIATEQTPPEVAATLQTKIERNASEVLAALQTSVEDSPAETRREARDSLKSVGEAYGERIQALAVKAPKTSAASGVLQLRAVDPLPQDVEALLLEVERIEVHRAGWPEDRWLEITGASQELNLLKLSNVQKFLGEIEAPAGIYTKIRFSIAGATVVVNGVSRPIPISNTTMEVTRPFRIEEGKTTVALLDFDAAASLRASRESFLLTPNVQLLAREPENGKANAGASDDGQKKEDGKQATPQPRDQGPASDDTKSSRGRDKPEVVEVEGVLQGILDGKLKIGNKLIALPPDIDLGISRDALRPGDSLKVEVAVQEDGSFLARDISVSERAKSEKPKDGNGGAKETTFSGTVQAMALQAWRVSGRTVRISPETKVKGTVAPGVQVEVKGILQRNGDFLALEVMVVEQKKDTAPRDEGARSDGNGAQQGSGKDGQRSETEEGTSKDSEKAGQQVRLAGVLGLSGSGAWTVEGRLLLIDDGTEKRGVILIGRFVDVVGVTQPDGSVRAIRVTGAGPSPQPGESTPTPLPTPSPTPTLLPREEESRPATPTPTAPRRVATPRVVPTAAPTQDIAALLTPTPTPVPPQAPTPVDGGGAVTIVIEGAIERIGNSLVVVAGRTVRISATTRIAGIMTVGARVRIEGVAGPGNIVNALVIEVIP
ncbi:MAG: DUF4382 domain-containing protein [Chloroflexi bacterium]|nr:DUF4382 domain-containing protein [Chloroflexota bacterium]